ncbi:MAG: DUF2085 domain-containing protein [Actinobacteria bacterium]|nr:DUF2085 domain-containing protein [Actinomycetota bacterium]MCL5025223.1 DUF2085 domain-containing protein [Chloroflexota bacterium]
MIPPASASAALAAPRERQLAVWISAHWLLLVNIALALYVGGAIASPLLSAVGWAAAGTAIFHLYSAVCHQLPWRSFFLFGQQIAICQRDLAIYGTMLGGGILYGLFRDRVPALSWQLYVLATLPMAIDGGTQLFDWRESTWELRLLTGFLFGLATVWTLYPAVERGLRASLTGGER